MYITIPTCSLILSGTLSVIGVLINPGRIALQRIPKLQVHENLTNKYIRIISAIMNITACRYMLGLQTKASFISS